MDETGIAAVLLAAALALTLAVLWRVSRKARLLADSSAQAGRDLEQLKREYSELLRERDLLHVLINSVPDQIFAKDKESRFLVANQAVAAQLRLENPQQALGKTDSEFFPQPEAAMYRREEEQVVATGQPVLDRVGFMVVNGRKVWLSTTKAPLHDKSGAIIGLVGVNRDITERQEAEEVLSEVVASARCILWDARVTRAGDGYRWQMRLHTSDQTRKELGLDRLPGETDGEVWPRHIPPEQLRHMNTTCYTALAGGAPGYQQEFAFTGAGGKEHWLKEEVRITTVGPEDYHLVGVCLDITDRKRAEAALRDREYLLRKVLDTNPNLIFLRDLEGKIILANAAFAASYDEMVEHVIGRLHMELHRSKGVPSAEVQQWLATDREVLETGQPMFMVNPATRLDGTVHWHRTRKLPLTLVNGKKAVLVICEDISDLKQAEDQLRKERDLLQALMDNIPDSIYFKDRESRFIRINAHKARGFGLAHPDEAVGKTDFDFYPEADAREFLADDRRVIAGEPIVGKTEHHVEGSTERWSLTSKAPFHGSSAEVLGIVGVSKDITYLKKIERQLGDANAQLQQLARLDSLTGLLNRRTILELLENEWARWQRYGKAFSVLVIDADDFKNINDSYGHLAGDQALRLLSTVLSQAVRAVDMVGRFGGEEFVVLLPETNLDGARVAADKVLQTIRRAELQWNGNLIRVTVSIGGAMCILGDRNIDALLYRADSALYAAKRNGKNQFVAGTA